MVAAYCIRIRRITKRKTYVIILRGMERFDINIMTWSTTVEIIELYLYV